MKSRLQLGLPGLWCGLLILVAFASVQAEKRKSGPETTRPEAAVVDSALQAKRHLSFGHTYLKKKQYEDAETQLARAWGLDPRNARTAYYLGRLCNEVERYDEAASWFGKAIEMSPGSKNTQNAYHYLTTIYALQEKRPETIAAYEALLTFSPDSEREIRYLRSLVGLCVDAGDFRAALTHARRWGELEPDSPDVQDMIGRLALRSGEEDEALERMEKVMEMDPDDYATLGRLAEIYRRRGEVQKAFDAYERLHANDPQNFLYLDSLYGLGVKLNRPRLFQAQTLQEMLRLQPKNLRAIEHLADLTGLIDVIDRGLKLDPKNGRFAYLKGEHYYKRWTASSAKGDSALALKWFEKAADDPRWRSSARQMVDHINPPMSEEEKRLRKFFGEKEKEVVRQEGKK